MALRDKVKEKWDLLDPDDQRNLRKTNGINAEWLTEIEETKVKFEYMVDVKKELSDCLDVFTEEELWEQFTKAVNTVGIQFVDERDKLYLKQGKKKQ